MFSNQFKPNNKGSTLSMTIKEVASTLVEGNKVAFTANASRRAGSMFNQRAVALIKPKLPVMVRGYADTELGEFVVANLIAAAIIKFGYTNDKLLMLADAGVTAANDKLLGSFNLEEMVNDLIDGIDTSGLTKAADTGRQTTASVLRKAADVADVRSA